MNTIRLNNWFSMGSELKKIGFLTFLAGIAVLGFMAWKQDTLILYPFLGVVGSLSLVVPLTVQEKDVGCQWERFSLTLPISRADIVRGNFRFFAEITALAFGFTLAMGLVGMALTQVLGFETPVTFHDVVTYLPLAVSLGFAGQSFIYLLTLIGKDTTAKMFHLCAALVGAVPYLISFQFFHVHDSLEDALMAFLCTTVISCVFMAISYVVAVKLIEKKEF
ncbi:MAG: ABC-2 transporter permease [Eubacteriales bacterium]